MRDSFSSILAFLIALMVIWLATRNSKSGYVRRQWRRPGWIVLRLLLLIASFHALFLLLHIPTVAGFLGLAIFWLVALWADLSGVFTILVIIAGALFYEWVFWFPSRHELILRNKKPEDLPDRSDLMGAVGVAVTDLKLFGRIEVAGAQHEAKSAAGLITKGEKVQVCSTNSLELVVRRVAQALSEGDRRSLQ